MASYKQNQLHVNPQIKSRNTVLYPLASTQSNNNYEKRIFETKFALRQNPHNVKPTIPIIYGIPQSTTAAESKNINFQKVLQMPGYTNPTSPRTPREKQTMDIKKQCQSQGNSPIRQQQYEQCQKERSGIVRAIVPTVSQSLSPQREKNELSVKTSIVPFQSPMNKGKKTLVLDLDETLIHSQLKKPAQFDLNFKIYSPILKEEFFVNFRPKVQQFLKIMASHYEIFVFTASIKEYADVIINQLDPTGTLISHRLYRESCRRKEDSYIKDLNLLNRNMKDIIIIDNLSTSFREHQENGIKIQDFTDNNNDNELEKLIPFLQFMSDVYDVRDVFKWQIKFENQSHFEFKNMQNQNKIFINESQENNQLKNQNAKQIAPYFIENKANNKCQQQQHIQQLPLLNQSKQNDSDKKEDYVYRSRRSVSNSLENSKASRKCNDSSIIHNLEHSFGGSQTVFCTDQIYVEDNQFNPLFQEFTFSKLKIEDSRVIEEEITKTTDRVIDKNNYSNKHERVPFKLIESGTFNQDSNNSSPQFNKSQQQGYHHSLQPTVFKLFEQSNSNILQTQSSNRNTPSFERNQENKENNRNLGNMRENLQKNLKGLIQEQKNKQIKQNSNNNSESSQRLSELSQNSTVNSSVNITQSKSIQNSQFNDTMRISFQNKSQNMIISQQASQDDTILSNENKQFYSTGTFKVVEDASNKVSNKNEEPLKSNRDCEYNIYQSHPIPRFLQLPTQKLEKPIQVQQKIVEQEKSFTFQPAKIQCEEQKQQQTFYSIFNEESKGRLSHKTQNKEVPQINKDPSLQSISMETRRHTLDTINIAQVGQQSNTQQKQYQQQQLQQSQQPQQQPRYPKIFEQQVVKQIPLMSNHISLSKYQQAPQVVNQNIQQKVEMPTQNIMKQQQQMNKSANSTLNKEEKVNQNNISLQQIQINQQQPIVPKRHSSQYVSSQQVQQQRQQQQSNYNIIKAILNETVPVVNRMSSSPIRDQANNKNLEQIGQINKKRQEFTTPKFVQNSQLFNIKQKEQELTQECRTGFITPSTACQSQNKFSDEKDKEDKKLNIQNNIETSLNTRNYVQPFEEYAKQGLKGPAVALHQKPNYLGHVKNMNTNAPNIFNNNNKIFTTFDNFIQKIN